MFFTHFILASLAVGTAVSSHHFYVPNTHVFGKRQQYEAPNPDLCAVVADTCEESCGAGFLLCSDPDTFLCYNPQQAHSCCAPGSAASWVCPDGDYCLVDRYCCPSGIDPQACALSLSISLPATYVGSAATPVVSNMTSAMTPVVSTMTSASTTPTSASNSVASYTGAASPNIVTGGRGLMYSILILVGNLF